MDYRRIYSELIHYAKTSNKQQSAYGIERHHILPTSLGGLDSPENVVFVTLRQHYIAHLLLCKQYPNQWFSIKAILDDCLPQRTTKRTNVDPKVVYKRWIRRNIAREIVKALNARNKK